MKLRNLCFFVAILITAMCSTANAQNRSIMVRTQSSGTANYKTTTVESITFSQSTTPPEWVKATLNNSNVNLEWARVESADKYNVYCRAAQDADYKIIATVGSSVQSYVHNYPAKGANYYAVTAVGSFGESQLTKCPSAVTLSGTEPQNGIYLGIVGFNGKITPYTLGILNSSTQSNYNSFINSLSVGESTALYKAVDTGLDILTAGNLPHELLNASVITFTDGRENYSVVVDDRYLDINEYTAAIKARIKDARVKNQPIQCYSIGLQGKDVDDTNYPLFLEDLRTVSTSNNHVNLIDSMSEIKNVFSNLASQITTASISRSITLSIPGQPDGTEVDFTFDNNTTPTTSTRYIRGIFSHDDHSLTLTGKKNFQLELASNAVVGTTSGIFVKYNFPYSLLSGQSAINTSYIRQWALTSTGKWQINSEFTPDTDITETVEQKSVAVILVLDCSSSLTEDDFKTLKSEAIAFISLLVNSSK